MVHGDQTSKCQRQRVDSHRHSVDLCASVYLNTQVFILFKWQAKVWADLEEKPGSPCAQWLEDRFLLGGGSRAITLISHYYSDRTEA